MTVRDGRAVSIVPGATEGANGTSGVLCVSPSTALQSVHIYPERQGLLSSREVASFRLNGRARWLPLVLSILAVTVVLILLGSDIPVAAVVNGSESSGLKSDSTPSITAGAQLEYPYVVSPSIYPNPSTIPGVITEYPNFVREVADEFGGFDVIFVGPPVSGYEYFELVGATYSASIAQAIFNCGLPGANATKCASEPAVPLSWTTPVNIGQVQPGAGPTSVAVAVSLGNIVVAASYQSIDDTNFFWIPLEATGDIGVVHEYSESGIAAGIAVTGGRGALSGNPTARVLITTLSSGTLTAYTIAQTSTSPPTVAQATLGPAGGVRNATPELVSNETGVREVVLATIPATSSIVSYTSVDGGESFGSVTVTVYNATSPSSVLDEVGSTFTVASGGLPGQLAATVSQSGVYLLTTTEAMGRVVPELLVSPNGGVSWEGPYFSIPDWGSSLDPQLAVSPEGWIYGTWRVVGNATWGLDQAVFSPAGGATGAPTSVLGADSNQSVGSPSVAVDTVGQPVYVWGIPRNSSSGTIGYTGDFPNAYSTAALVDSIATDPLSPIDFSPSGSGLQPGAFDSTVGGDLTAIENAVQPGGSQDSLSTAQNDTLKTLVPFLTSISLNTTGGAPAESKTDTPLARVFGYFSPDLYLAIYSVWLSESLAVTVTNDPFTAAPSTSQAGYPVIPGTYTSPPASDGAEVNFEPIPQSPTDVELNIGSSFPSYQNSHDLSVCGTYKVGGVTYDEYIYYENESNVQYYWTTVSADQVTETWDSQLSVAYLTNLTPGSSYTVEVGAEAQYQQTEYYGDECNTALDWSKVIYPPTLGPFDQTVSVKGPTTTTLAIVPYAPYVNTVWTGKTLDYATYQWTNSILAASTAYLNVSTKSSLTDYTGLNTYVLDEFNSLSADTGKNASATIVSHTRTGGWNSTQEPAASDGTNFAWPGAVATASCTFQLFQPTFTVSAPYLASVNGSSAEVNWSSTINRSAPSTLTYYEFGSGSNFTESNVTPSNSASPYTYSVELHGLDTVGTLHLTASVSYSGTGCVSQEVTNSSSQVFNEEFVIQETDLPYDSISHEGGGALITWSLPSTFIQSATFDNGTITYSGPNGTVVVPISSPSEFNTYAGGWSWLTSQSFDLSSLSPLNANFTLRVDLNYTQAGHSFPLESPSITFVYEKDTSGDGLTDAEKEAGWPVTYTTAPGTVVSIDATANPSKYSTNGLVSDYLEKEYGLNPYTVDTAGSHMLDTWNLTFSLAGDGNVIPGNFHVWYENSTFKPFAQSVEYAPGLYEDGGPQGQKNNSSIAANPVNGTTSGDGSPKAATYLWSYLALVRFNALPGVEHAGRLDAIEGSWKGISTLTVSGKLSWEIDPLVASSPNDAIADGARVNPAYQVGLSVTVTHLYVEHLVTGEGYAAQFQLYAGASATGTPELTNYSAPVGLAGGISLLTGYTVILPTNQTSQFETILFEVLYNKSGTLTPVPFDGSLTEVAVTYDMVHAAVVTESWLDTSGSNPNGTLDLSMSTVPLGQKNPTYLWLPTENGTTNGLPVGLDRYTGEQSFDLVVVNAPTNLTSVNVPYPGGGNYTISLRTGLNNLLIPREQFLNSSFAAAILQGKDFPYPSTHPPPPIVSSDTIAQSLLTPFGATSGLMFDLEAYWQNRAINPGTAGNFTTAENGTSITSYLQVRVAAVYSTPPANNTGGLASNPSVYSTVQAPPALQTIVTLNVTSQAIFDLLLAALLDNSTGAWNGVNGTFQSITNQVESMGFDAPVLAALANVPVVSQGLYGPPTYSKEPSASGIWGDFWNAVTAVVTTISGAIVSIVGEVYSAAVAVAIYLDGIAHEALAIGGELLARTAATLVHVGDTIVSALNAILEYILSLVKGALASVVDPVVSAAKGFDQALGATSNTTVLDVSDGGSVTPAHALAWAHAFDPAAYLGTAIALVVTIAFGILLPFSLGGGFLIGILISLLPHLAQYLVPGLPAITSLTSQAVTSVEDGVTNTISSTDWTALAESVGLAASSTDFAWTIFSVSAKGAVDGGAALSLLLTMIIDSVILLVTLGSIVANSPYVAGTILFLGLFALSISTLFLLSDESVELKPYAAASVALAGLGVGAGLADLKAQGLL